MRLCADWRIHYRQQNRGDSHCLRALGPSLQQFGIANPLPDPQLALFNANGTLLASDDNWQTHPAQAAAIISYGLVPSNNLESAIAISLAPGSYTAIVSGKNNQTGRIDRDLRRAMIGRRKRRNRPTTPKGRKRVGGSGTNSKCPTRAYFMPFGFTN